MKTIKKNIKDSERGKTFNLHVAEVNSNFEMLLKNVIDECIKLFPNIDFETTIINDPEEFKLKEIKKSDLVFIESEFLLDIPKQVQIKPYEKQDVVLLLDSHFVGEGAAKIKEVITENSLNLTGHISLTNYPFSLIKLLVIDFIKSKLHSYGGKNI